MPKVSKQVSNIIEANSIHYNNIVYELKKDGHDVIVLSLGEAFFDIPLYSFDDLPFPDIYHYSHSRGIIGLREKLSKYFKQQYSFAFNPNTEIIITAGSKVAIQMAFMSILDKGDEVIVLEPYWVSYTEQIKICHASPKTIPYDENVYNLDKYLTEKTKCIVLNNPHNPTGKIYTEKELKYLLELAIENDIYILSDEVSSASLPHESVFHSFGKYGNKENIIVVNSISKNYGISGWRLGYVIAGEKLINQILKLNQHMITCPSTILEYYIEKHFDEIIQITKPQIAKLIAKRKEVTNFMDKINLKYLPGETTFYIFVSIAESKLGSEEFCSKLLEKYNVSVVPGIGYGDSCDNFIRISIGSENMKRINAGLSFIKKLISSTSFSNE